MRTLIVLAVVVVFALFALIGLAFGSTAPREFGALRDQVVAFLIVCCTIDALLAWTFAFVILGRHWFVER